MVAGLWASLLPWQKIARFMKKKVELRRTECEGLKGNICWSKVDNLKKGDNKTPLNGYRIEFTGDVGLLAYKILKAYP